MSQRIELQEPVIHQLVTVLEEGLPPVIAGLNAELSDDFLVEPPVRIIPYMPVAVTLEGGMPIVAIQDMGATFMNDLQHSMEGEHKLGIVSILQTSDHQTLAWQLRRYTQAVMQTIQKDRMLGVASVLRAPPAEVIYTRFTGTEPGPMLGDRNPDDEGAPPSSFRSWTWLLLECRRQEILG